MTSLISLLSAALPLIALGSGAAAEPDPVGVWPLQPTHEVVHDFDPPDDPWGSGHRGVDLAGRVGQSVHTALDGSVAFVGTIAGKPVVTISHGETRTTYEPVTSELSKGDVVAAGQRIGSLELTFSHCFPIACLHWGWLRDKTYLDPLDLVGDVRVRLLPLWRDQPVDHGSSSPWQPITLPAIQLPYAAWSPGELLGVHVPVRDPRLAQGPADRGGPPGRPTHDDVAVGQVRRQLDERLVVGAARPRGQPR